MFKEVLESLSDTELLTISNELKNEEIDITHIIMQLIAKSNSPILWKLEDLKSQLVIEMSNELGKRTLS